MSLLIARSPTWEFVERARCTCHVHRIQQQCQHALFVESLLFTCEKHRRTFDEEADVLAADLALQFILSLDNSSSSLREMSYREERMDVDEE